jgi:hypothetical protein
MSVGDSIRLYEEVAQEIFDEEQAITGTKRFSSKKLGDVLQSRIRNILGVEWVEIFLHDPDVEEGRGCPM